MKSFRTNGTIRKVLGEVSKAASDASLADKVQKLNDLLTEIEALSPLQIALLKGKSNIPALSEVILKGGQELIDEGADIGRQRINDAIRILNSDMLTFLRNQLESIGANAQLIERVTILEESKAIALTLDLTDAGPDFLRAFNLDVEGGLVRAWEVVKSASAPSEVRRSTSQLLNLQELITNDEFLDFFRTLNNSNLSWPNILDFIDESVIKFWTTKSGYKEFNHALINGTQLTPFFSQYKTSLILALSKLENYILPSGSRLYRGVVIDVKTFNQKYVVGNSFPEDFFTATSKNYNTGKEFLITRMAQSIDDIENGNMTPVFFKVEGNVGKDISAGALANEAEVLFKPGTDRIVIDVTSRQIPDAQTVLDEFGPTYFNLVNDYDLQGLQYFEVTIRIND